MQRYVGVTGVTRPQEVSAIRRILDALDWPPDVKYMNGVLASRKTFGGMRPDNPAQYRPLCKLPGLFCSDPRFINVVHFNSREPRLARDLRRLAGLSGKIDAIQLNIAWPDKLELAAFQQWLDRQDRNLGIILQISAAAYAAIGRCPSTLQECVRSYTFVRNLSVLVDPSGGLGLRFDARQVASALEAVAGLGVGVGVAGGLDARDVARRLPELVQAFPSLSWDAQTQLRVGSRYERDASGRITANRPLPAAGGAGKDWDLLDMGRVEAFLRASRELL